MNVVRHIWPPLVELADVLVPSYHLKISLPMQSADDLAAERNDMVNVPHLAGGGSQCQRVIVEAPNLGCVRPLGARHELAGEAFPVGGIDSRLVFYPGVAPGRFSAVRICRSPCRTGGSLLFGMLSCVSTVPLQVSVPMSGCAVPYLLDDDVSSSQIFGVALSGKRSLIGSGISSSAANIAACTTLAI